VVRLRSGQLGSHGVCLDLDSQQWVDQRSDLHERCGRAHRGECIAVGPKHRIGVVDVDDVDPCSDDIEKAAAGIVECFVDDSQRVHSLPVGVDTFDVWWLGARACNMDLVSDTDQGCARTWPRRVRPRRSSVDSWSQLRVNARA